MVPESSPLRIRRARAEDATELTRLARHPYLADLRPFIQHLLARGLKLEQEAVTLATGQPLLGSVAPYS